MTRLMLIDANHPEETRVVVVTDDIVQEFDYATLSKQQIKGNIYLAKITRVEPSLQAAFVEYGGNRQGFLPFAEIHPDYYQIPVEDKEKLVREVESEAAKEFKEQDHHAEDGASEPGQEGEDEHIETIAEDDDSGEQARKRLKFLKRYKIQEVIKKGQIMLVQVTKEERGNKGAAMTSYLSLPGRYCVLMPNTRNAGGISRKINSGADRKRLKDIADSISKEQGLSAIIRTAGAGRSRAEIKRDFDYLFRLWNEIRENTLKSSAPALIYEESDIIKRSIRDLYQSEIEQILVQGEEAYKDAKTFMKMLMPSHAARIKQYKGDVPLFYAYDIEEQLMAMYDPTAGLKSGGYLVIHQTEALVSIDVNSGKSTKERSVEETALRTNIEAAYELARQLRLRDLAGLLVIDFIDMYEYRNRRAVERALKDALKQDRAKIQIGRISPFGLLEMSRQRLRPSITESNEHSCPMCNGMGTVRSADSISLQLLRMLEKEAFDREFKLLNVRTQQEIAFFLLNHKRAELSAITAKYGVPIYVEGDATILSAAYRIERIDAKTGNPSYVDENGNLVTKEGIVRNLRGKARREAGNKSSSKAVAPPDYAYSGTVHDESDEEATRRGRDRDRHRDRNRGGEERGERNDRDRRSERGERGGEQRQSERNGHEEHPERGEREERGGRRRRRRRGRDRDRDRGPRPVQAEESREDTYVAEESDAPESLLMGDTDQAAPAEERKERAPRSRVRRGRSDKAAETATETVAEAPAAEEAPDASEKPVRSRSTRARSPKKTDEKTADKPAAKKAADQPKPAAPVAVVDAAPAPVLPQPAKTPTATRTGPKRQGWWASKTAEETEEAPIKKAE